MPSVDAVPGASIRPRVHDLARCERRSKVALHSRKSSNISEQILDATLQLKSLRSTQRTISAFFAYDSINTRFFGVAPRPQVSVLRATLGSKVPER